MQQYADIAHEQVLDSAMCQHCSTHEQVLDSAMCQHCSTHEQVLDSAMCLNKWIQLPVNRVASECHNSENRI